MESAKLEVRYLTDLYKLGFRRSILAKLHVYDPKIDRIFDRLRTNSSSFAFDYANSVDFYFNIANSKSNFYVNISQFSLDNMTDNKKTLKKLAIPNVFHAIVGEDRHKHLNEFHVMCSTIWLHGILEDYIKIKEFPFSLDGVTKD
ncbi:hypothetical protein CR513_09737, partial [Mucuna pruriens]